jgi:NADH-quinone oxidoreductase subunit F
MANANTLLGSLPVIRVSAGSDHETEARRVTDAARERAGEVRVALVGPTGASGLDPLVFATQTGRTAIVPSCDREMAEGIVTALEDGDFDNALPTSTTIVEHDSQPTLPIPESGPLSVGRRRVLDTAGWLRPTSIEEYRNARSVVASAIDSETVLALLEDVPLRGRGRGDAATDRMIVDRWKTVRESDDEPIVVVNANEADRNATMDRLLLESTPLSVLDGAAVAARTVGASEVVIYANETETLVQDRVRKAADRLTNELDDGDRSTPVSIETVTGPDEYKAGEMTMAIEALEGNHRLEARLRPPLPSEFGIDGRPTLIHTPRTLAQVAELLRENSDGNGDGSDSVGVDSDPGTRLLTVTGDIESPVTLELSTADDLSSVRDAVQVQGRLKAACVGDVFGGITSTLDVPASANGLTSARLGTNGVVELFNHDRCMVSIAGDRARFASEENCGRCVTCREGSKQLTELLRDVYDGSYDSQIVHELGRVMEETSICEFGQEAPRPAMTAMNEFEPEFHAHAQGRCPTGACD